VSRNETYALDQALPAALAAGSSAPWADYRRYPVFSWPWLWRRLRLFALSILGIATLIVVGRFLTRELAWEQALLVFVSGIAFVLISSMGPLLATLWRQRQPGRRHEGIGVVAAIALGAVASLFVDMSVSTFITERAAQFHADGVADAGKAVERGPVVWLVNVLWLAVIYLALGGGIALRAYFRERRRWSQWQRQQELESLREARRDSDLRLGVLQAQVEPHFLFNTLASVRSLIRDDPDRAELSIDALVDYLRASIPRLRGQSAQLHSTLAQQVEICERYLQVMQIRMDDRLSYHIEVSPAIQGAAFPPLLLISLVENAIKHGVEPKPGHVRIEIAAERIEHQAGDRLVVRVEDNGVGLGATPGHGVGLSNVREQLATRFGDRATLRVEGREAGGVRACISLPWETRNG
jgi:two-component sensor histidine kinase